MCLRPWDRREKILIQTIELQELQIDPKIQIGNLRTLAVEFS